MPIAAKMNPTTYERLSTESRVSDAPGRNGSTHPVVPLASPAVIANPATVVERTAGNRSRAGTRGSSRAPAKYTSAGGMAIMPPPPPLRRGVEHCQGFLIQPGSGRSSSWSGCLMREDDRQVIPRAGRIPPHRCTGRNARAREALPRGHPARVCRTGHYFPHVPGRMP